MEGHAARSGLAHELEAVSQRRVIVERRRRFEIEQPVAREQRAGGLNCRVLQPSSKRRIEKDEIKRTPRQARRNG